MVVDPNEVIAARVENFVRYRPGYPVAVLEMLRAGFGLSAGWVVADIGSGTGNLTRLFLDNGNTVFAVEPHQQMREAGERLLRGYPGLVSVVGSAERTRLAAASVDLVVAGQAFHWFDVEACKREFQRILRAPRRVALVWNEFRVASSPVLASYEQLLRRYGTDPATVNPCLFVTADVLARFFAPGGYEQASVPNAQLFDFAALQGRLHSVASMPEPSHPAHATMIDELRNLFDTHQTGGRVTFEYDTTVYHGRI